MTDMAKELKKTKINLIYIRSNYGILIDLIHLPNSGVAHDSSRKTPLNASIVLAMASSLKS